MPVDSPGSAASDPLTGFSAPAREWFGAAFDAPTAAQAGAWASIRQDQHTLVVAPTGSGKTLAAFLWALDGLLAGAGPDAQPGTVDASQRCRVLYVSPLKALASDVQRNLSSPLIGIHAAGQRLGLELAPVQIGIRSGDTPAAERARFARHPPDILITTPESLFLLLTSRAGQALAHVRTVIVDEVHAVAGTKRGAHLALSLERLDALTDRPVQRVGLSATVRPIETVAQFLTGTRTPAEGGRAVQIVAPPAAKTFDLSVQVPVPDMTELGAPTGDLSGNAAGEVARHSIWPAVEERVVDLIAPSGPHRSSLVFTNSRRLAERLTARLNEIWEQRWMAADALAGSAGQAPVGQAPSGQAPVGRPPAQMMAAAGQTAGAPPILAKAHHGSVSMQQRALIEDDLKSGRLPAVVATSSLELGIDMGAIDLVVQVEAPPSVSSGLQRVGRAGHQVGAVSRGVILPKFRGDLVTSAV
ncbi:MAG: DEAD/DEAH box helicase, partial [Micrococcales bacterium]